MHFPILQDIVILLAFSLLIVFALQRIKWPPVLGFLITGMIIGPYGLSLVSAMEEIELLSEIGIILLLFVIGMELSIKQLISIRKTVFIGGSLQVGLTILVVGLVYYLLGYTWNESVFTGFLFSLSSTAIVLKVLQDKNEVSAQHGRNVLGILIFQDIIVVPMMLMVPILAGKSGNPMMSLASLGLKSVAVFGITFISARYLAPRLMHAVALTKSRELFVLTTITLCFAIAFLTSEAGLSLALGAFLAGLIISESEYSHQATSHILPFREVFTSFFFISVGMMLDLPFFFNHLGMILMLVLGVFILKSTLAAIAVAVLKYPPKTVLLTGLSLFQVGEFAFILSKVGIKYGLLNPETNQYFLAVSIVSMMLTPFIILFSGKISDRFFSHQLVKRWIQPVGDPENADWSREDGLDDHLVIIGYGINGSNLAKASLASSIPFIVIENNAEIVRAARSDGIPIFFGDATDEHILETARINHARAVVIAISDPEATRNLIKGVRRFSQSVYLLVRSRFIRDIDEWLALGADDIIPEEFETSVEIFSRVLHQFLVPEHEIDQFIENLRSGHYQLFQNRKVNTRTLPSPQIPDFQISCLRVRADSGKLIGKKLSDSNVGKEYGIQVLAIFREDEMMYNIGPEEKILQHDVLYVNGKPDAIESFHRMVS